MEQKDMFSILEIENIKLYIRNKKILFNFNSKRNQVKVCLTKIITKDKEFISIYIFKPFYKTLCLYYQNSFISTLDFGVKTIKNNKILVVNSTQLKVIDTYSRNITIKIPTNTK